MSTVDTYHAPCAISLSAGVRPESCASKNASTSSMTPSSSTSVSSSVSSSSSFASSIANGVRSNSAAAFAAAWNMLGIGEYSTDAGGPPNGGVPSGPSVDVDADDESLAESDGSMGLARLALDGVRRMVGVSSDSRAFGSSSVVYLPIAGRV